ncbi:ABC transporter permease [Paenibacillus sp. NPDC057934]|uniref:ABC transporter permease n=1 Tax=Paenibacillus sp. NPDC057934 TaxID=3346282 RepID=UPI0036D8408C
MQGITIVKRIFLTEIQYQAMRRIDVIIGFLFLWLPILLNVFLWKAVYGMDPGADAQLGYSLDQITTYFVVVLICNRLVGTNINTTMNQQILDGSLNQFLLKPSSHFTFHIVKHIGHKSAELIYMLIPGCVLFFIFQNSLLVPKWEDFLLFVLAILLGFCIHFLMYYALGMLGFWFGRAGQIMTFIVSIISLLDGSKFPTDFLPKWLNGIFLYFPFQYIFYFPIRIFLGSESMASILRGLTLQGIWVFAIGAICIVAWRKGIARFGAFGG